MIGHLQRRLFCNASMVGNMSILSRREEWSNPVGDDLKGGSSGDEASPSVRREGVASESGKYIWAEYISCGREGGVNR